MYLMYYAEDGKRVYTLKVRMRAFAESRRRANRRTPHATRRAKWLLTRKGCLGVSPSSRFATRRAPKMSPASKPIFAA